MPETGVGKAPTGQTARQVEDFRRPAWREALGRSLLRLSSRGSEGISHLFIRRWRGAIRAPLGLQLSLLDLGKLFLSLLEAVVTLGHGTPGLGVVVEGGLRTAKTARKVTGFREPRGV